MKYNKVQNGGFEISALSLGTWVFGGESWSGAKEDDCLSAVRCAIERGITCIDTAPIYSNGVSETIVGRGIKGKRDKLVIATKCGLKVSGKSLKNDLSPQSIFQEIDASLKRLRTDYVDIYQCHWPDQNVPIEKTMAALLKLKSSGKIRHIGLSNHSVDEFKKALAVTQIATSQDQYSILNREIEESLLPFLREENIGLLAYGPLAGGILTGKYKEPPKLKGADARNFFYKYYSGEVFAETGKLLEQLRSIGRPLGQVAVNWVRRQPGVASVLIGCRNASHVEENVKAADWDLTQEQVSFIDNLTGVGSNG